jgi:hypothetical protein
MAEQESYAARGHTPASNRRKEPREGVEEVLEHKLPKKAITTQPSPAPDTSRLRPANKASYKPPPFEKGADFHGPQGAVYGV